MPYIQVHEPRRFFVSRLKENAVVAWKGNTMVVFPRKEGRRYAVGVCITCRLRKMAGTEMFA